MENSMSRILIETVIKRTLRNIKDNPERGIRNLIDMALQFSEGRFQKKFFTAAQTMLQNENSAYYDLVRDVVSCTDSDRLLTFGMNLGYNGCTIGAQRIRENEKKFHCNIPWALTLLNDDEHFENHKQKYHAIIQEGESPGIYVWMLFPMCHPEKILSLAEKHPDSAFCIFCRAEDITGLFLDEVVMLHHVMIVVRYEENSSAIFDLLRKEKLLYSAWYPYGQKDTETIINGDLFSSAVQCSPVFTVLLPETLGGASVICSDKTGTLTQNRMTLVKAYPDGARAAEDINAQNSDKVRTLLTYGALCCNGSVIFHGREEQHIGDPTETAIILAAHKNGMPKDMLNNTYPRLAEIPFDSDRKLMTTINRIDGKNIVIVKGAFDVMASRCVTGNLGKAAQINEEMSKNALRVLAIGYKEIETVPSEPTPEKLENGLTFMGLVGMIDPPRPEAKDAVEVCRRAGIKPVMITGDHVVTASAIAKELGILAGGDKAITGRELDAMTDTELDASVENISVYARVSPENKIRIVKSWQRKGQVVAMTGDGVNDAPALKAADIGCAMGITGTDVAKGAADMTLTDDNFATIVEAVKEGRGIYANIKKVVGYLLGTNIGEVVCVFVAMLLWHKSPLLSMQLLWINLVTDSLPAIALGMEPVESDIMQHPPKPKDEGLFAHGLGVRIVLQGVMFGVLSLAAYYLGESATGLAAGGQTMAFMVLALSQVIQAFNMRSEHSLFRTGVFTNQKLNLAALISIALVLLVLFTPLSVLFGLIRLPGNLYLIGLIMIFIPVLVMELSKAFGLIKHQH